MQTFSSLPELLAQLLAGEAPTTPTTVAQSNLPPEIVALINQLNAQGYQVRSLECVKLDAEAPAEPAATKPEAVAPERADHEEARRPLDLKHDDTFDQTWAKFATLFSVTSDEQRRLVELMRHAFYAGASAALDRVAHHPDYDRADLRALLAPLMRELIAFVLRA